MELNYNRNFIPGRLGAVLAVALVAGSPLASAAETVMLHRGATVTRVTTGGQDLELARGPAVLSRIQARGAETGSGAMPTQVLAGERLWLVDAEAGRLSVCTLRGTTQVGPDAVRCRTRALPRASK